MFSWNLRSMRRRLPFSSTGAEALSSALMATVCARPALVATRPSSAQQSINTSVRGKPTAVPNKHLPDTCSPGPTPTKLQQQQLETPPGSPGTPNNQQVVDIPSLLVEATKYPRVSDSPPIYALTAQELHEALDHTASRPLPDTKTVFPWLHGLHPENSIQLTYFSARNKKQFRRSPRTLRGITLVKAGGDLTHSKLKGAIAPDELLLATKTGDQISTFLDVDPRDGFSIRNFQIQAVKMATMSDVVVYADDKTSNAVLNKLASIIARAQKVWREKDRGNDVEVPQYHTYMVTETFAKLQAEHPEIVAVDDSGNMTGEVMDFFHSERYEMHTMSSATEIANNVWLGPTPDASLTAPSDPDAALPSSAQAYDLFVEATDPAQLPDYKAFQLMESLLSNPKVSNNAIPQLEFPGSGAIMPPTWSQTEVDALMDTVAWLYKQANPEHEESMHRKDSQQMTPPKYHHDADGDIGMIDLDLGAGRKGRKILIHCTDGYTETSMLALAYYMYANCATVDRAYVELHTKHHRNLFSYPTDVALLSSIQPRILQSSPNSSNSMAALCQPSPAWFSKMDGSFPSRIMNYMYLGNLGHANNPDLLRELNIGQVLSIGETINWTSDETRRWKNDARTKDSILYVDGVQDNGVDPLTSSFDRCLDFIRKGREAGVATLVHCRVGVSRSATICIAEVMNEFGISFPRAYCFVRARRLNVIIQPHLRFSYELLKWEEYQCSKRGKPVRRELEWGTIAREIAAMNRPYSRQ
ncbi:tyrosine protein phosphatase 1 [Aureobasidium subglaciale]|nr:tyrosine protein phosphatase 1 [Aureobasidium subglaciale]